MSSVPISLITVAFIRRIALFPQVVSSNLTVGSLKSVWQTNIFVFLNLRASTAGRRVCRNDAPHLQSLNPHATALLARVKAGFVPSPDDKCVKPILTALHPFGVMLLCGPYGCVAQQLGEFLHRDTLFQKVNRKRVPEPVADHVSRA